MREFIEESGQASDLADLVESFERAIRRLNFEHYSFSYCVAKPNSGAATQPEHRVLALNYPSHWVEHYRDQDYFRRDPVIRHARATVAPYQWTELPVQCDRELLVLQEASDAGLREGLAIPIHEPWGRVFLATLATKQAQTSQRAADAQVQIQAHVLAVIFHSRYSALCGAQAQDPLIGLTPRESECLGWVAQGKSSWDIGQLMAVSEHTVNFHLKNAMRKFDTASRVTAAVRAASLGLIELP